jgi:methylase of polypeptide subunit release factors
VLAEPPSAADGDALEALRRALTAAGFTVEGIEERLGTNELSLRPIDTAVHLRRLAGDDAFATLARLFLLGVPVDAGRLAPVLASPGLDRLAAVGLIELAGGEARPTARLAPHGDYYIASDGGAEANTPYDYVPGIQAPSVTLAKLAVRRRVDSALDLGTGCGIQALLAAKHAERVVATDVNPRALAFASFNARLNGIDTIELRLGNAFEAVASERFDLIVANPLYVISPDTTYAYRDSDLAADELCRLIVGEAPAFLAEGGFAHVLVSWGYDPAGDWASPLRGWVHGGGCDAWLLHYRTNDPLTHAASWLRPLGETDPAAYEQALDRWTQHLSGLGIEAIGHGAIVLRRRAGAGEGECWLREDPLPLDKLEPAGDHTLRVFAGQDLLERAGASELLEARLALTPQHKLEQRLQATGGGFSVRGQTLELTDGLCFSVGVDRHTASLLPYLDGRPLREALVAAATTFELDASERDNYVPAAVPVVRRLLALGFLVEVGGSG